MGSTGSGNRPLPNSYRVIDNQLLAGEYPGGINAVEAAKKLKPLIDAGVNHFIDLTKPGELVPYIDMIQEEAHLHGLTVEWERHPIVDVSVPHTPEYMAQILDAVDAALADGKTVYLHCFGGVGRTGTVVGCWLVRHGFTGDQALAQIAQWWQTVEKAHRLPMSPETSEQREYVRHWVEPSKEELRRDITTQDRFRGCLLGLAVGDALGTTLEFKKPGTFPPMDGLIGGGPFGLQPGQWTDDTSMALCLATSLIENSGFEPKDQMQRYVRWRDEGYLSATGSCFDIGTTVNDALSRFIANGNSYAGSTDPMSAGNGSLMRLAPVPMFYAFDANEAIYRSAESSRTTHAAEEAIDACR